MFVKLMLPWRKKIVLICVFSLGFFVILAAILNKYYSFTRPFGAEWTFWYVRESSTAILVANLPFLWTLIRRVFNVRSLDGTTNGTTANKGNSSHDRTITKGGDSRRKQSQAFDPASGSINSTVHVDLEMTQSGFDRPMGKADISLEEMLREGSDSSNDDNSQYLPYSHGPQVQYSVWAEGPASSPHALSDMQKAKIKDRRQLDLESYGHNSYAIERRSSTARLMHSPASRDPSDTSPRSPSFQL